MGRMIAAAGLTLLAGPLQAEIYAYRCKAPDGILSLKVDDARNELTWRGKTYRLAVQEGCARFGWHAERQGSAFEVCTATGGYADFKENGVTVRCDQHR